MQYGYDVFEQDRMFDGGTETDTGGSISNFCSSFSGQQIEADVGRNSTPDGSGGDPEGTPGNYADFGVVANGSGVRGAQGGAYLYGASIWLYDPAPPNFNNFTPPSTAEKWIDDRDSSGNPKTYTQPFNIDDNTLGSANTPGLGAWGVDVSVVQNWGTGWNRIWNSCPTGTNPDSSYRIKCATPFTGSMPYSFLWEGWNTVSLTAFDVGNDSVNPDQKRVVSWHQGIDRSPPNISLSGSLSDAAGKEVYSDPLSLHVDATDGTAGSTTPSLRSSGVYSITVTATDSAGSKTTLASKTQSCATDSCAVSLDASLDPTQYASGSTTVSVIATDMLQHAATATRSFTISDVDPLVSESEMVNRSHDFRNLYNLPATDDTIRSLLENTVYDSSRNTYGVPLTSREAQTVNSDSVPQGSDPGGQVDSYSSSHASGDYAGSYQSNGKIIVLYTANGAADFANLKSNVSHPELLQQGSAQWTLAHLVQLQTTITNDWNALLSLGVNLSSVSVDIVNNNVELQVDGLTPSISDLLHARYPGEPLSIIDGAVTSTAGSGPSRARDVVPASPFVAGLTIRPSSNDPLYCTSGFVFQVGSAQQLYPVIFTAAHCIKHDSDHWFQGGQGVGYPYKKVNGGPVDAALIGVRSPATNGVFITSHVTQPIDTLEHNYDSHVGQHVCVSGSTGGVRCGKVIFTRANIRVDGVLLTDQRAFSVSKTMGSTDPCKKGDSGGPTYNGDVGMGIVSAVSNNKRYCYYTGIDNAQAYLQQDQNILNGS